MWIGEKATAMRGGGGVAHAEHIESLQNILFLYKL